MSVPPHAARLEALLAERILLLDGAMGTMIQRARLAEEDYRGQRFRDWGRELKGNNDLLSLTQPALVRDIHAQYLQAGADIIETNTFNSTAIALADYGMRELAREFNRAAANLAKDAVREAESKNPQRPRFVAGVLGPTNKTASISPDVNDPGFRAVTFEELSAIAETRVSCHPNAGLPNAFGEYDDTPEAMAAHIGEWARSGWLNVVGGCCGTTPEHIRAMADAVHGVAARQVPTRERALRLSGLEPLNVGDESLFVNIGERANVTGSRAFARLVLAGDYAGALSVARQQVENGAQVIDVNMDEAMLDSEQAMTTFLRLAAAEPDIARVPFMIDSSKWSVIEAGLKCVQGKPIVNSISMKEGEAEFLRQARLCRKYGAAA